jgi:hypothetical protein
MSFKYGIFQGDLIIETALRYGIKDARANPWAIECAFESLTEDPITISEYGKKQIDSMVRWVMKTEIPVFLNTSIEDSRLPAITINLVDSVESDNTLGDIHYDPYVPDNSTWPPLCKPFTPLKWTSTTGEMILPDTTATETYVFPGMKVIDRQSIAYPILDVQTDSADRTVVTIAPGTIADFTGAVIKAKDPHVIAMESAEFRESYLIGCHVSGEPWQLVALHTFVEFILLRYRESLLEARGFEVSAISSTDFSKNQAFDPEQAWSRYVSLSGKCRKAWPKERYVTMQGLDAAFKVTDGKKLPRDTNPDTALWTGDEDSLGGRTKR